MMTKDFEPVTEVKIHQDEFGEGKCNGLFLNNNCQSFVDLVKSEL